MSEHTHEDILRFWFEEIDHSSWFKKDDEFDRRLEARFGDLLARAKQNELDSWCDTPLGRLALIVVLDQFPRNIFRDSPKAFEGDAKALGLTISGIELGVDTSLTLEQRSFFYLPLRHAEYLAAQELGLTKTREINAAGYGSDKYALSHLETIKRFGRFPHRNKSLGRENTAEEEIYLSEGNAGY